MNPGTVNRPLYHRPFLILCSVFTVNDIVKAILNTICTNKTGTFLHWVILNLF